MSGQERDRPKARAEELVVQELDRELLVYDLKRHQAHCLTAEAADVLRGCDGRRTPGQLAAWCGQPEEVVWAALGELEVAGLLEQAPTLPARFGTRRELLWRLALAGLAVPLVTSIVAPMAVSAQTVEVDVCGQEGCNTNPLVCPPGCECDPFQGADGVCVPMP